MARDNVDRTFVKDAREVNDFSQQKKGSVSWAGLHPDK
jgi:hypothetical protein